MSGLDIDVLISRLFEIREQIGRLRSSERTLVTQLADLCQGEAKTRRVRGDKLRIKVEMPGPSWDQCRLRELWHNYPRHNGSVLRIEKLGVSLREYNKILQETGDDTFLCFRSELISANLGPRGLPYVTLEE